MTEGAWRIYWAAASQPAKKDKAATGGITFPDIVSISHLHQDAAGKFYDVERCDRYQVVLSSPRSRIPIINPESVKLVGISLEIADLAIVFTHDIFIVYVLTTWNIIPQLYVYIHTYIYIFINRCYPMIIIIEIIENNFRPTRLYISTSK